MNRKQAALLSVLAGVLVLMTGARAAPTVYPYGVTIHEGGVAQGYVIFGGQDGNVHLVDASGTDVHAWTAPCDVTYAVRPLDDGHVLTESCGDLVELDWNGTIVWQFSPPPDMELHDDWERMPNGNTLTLCRETINEPSISDESIVDDCILEVSPVGDVVWEWHLSDHFGELGFSQERIDAIFDRGGDWSHATSVSRISENTSHGDPRFIPGNIIIALQHQNTVAVIERATNQIVWVSTDFATGPHTVYMIPNDLFGGNHVLMFDGGFAGDWHLLNRDHSRVWEVDPAGGFNLRVYRSQDSGLRSGAFFSHFGGGAQRLSNGNTLITEAIFGRIFEVTTGGQIVWEYVSPYFNSAKSNATYRAYKVPLEWVPTGRRSQR
jgi:hypothetical protein